MSESSTPRRPLASLRDALFRAFLLSFLMLFMAMVVSLILVDVSYPKGSDWLQTLTTDRDKVWFSVKLSLITSTVTLIAAMIVGLPSAYALSRFKLPFATVVDTIIDLPIVIPPPVIGLSLVAAFGRTGLDAWMVRNLGSGLMFEAWGIPLAQFMVAAAFCIRALKATFDGINPRLEHVARTLGCTPWQAFVRVALPLARNGIIAGAIMTWARAISEFGPVLFFCGTFEGKTDVLPIRMFLNMSAGQPAQAIVLAILMIAIAATALIAFKKLGGKGYLW